MQYFHKLNYLAYIDFLNPINKKKKGSVTQFITIHPFLFTLQYLLEAEKIQQRIVSAMVRNNLAK